MNAKEYMHQVELKIATHGHRDNKLFIAAAEVASMRMAQEAPFYANHVKSLIVEGLRSYVPGAPYFDPIVAVEYATLTAHVDFTQ